MTPVTNFFLEKNFTHSKSDTSINRLTFLTTNRLLKPSVPIRKYAQYLKQKLHFIQPTLNHKAFLKLKIKICHIRMKICHLKPDSLAK